VLQFSEENLDEAYDLSGVKIELTGDTLFEGELLNRGRYKWYQSLAPNLVVCVGGVRTFQGAEDAVCPCEASWALEYLAAVLLLHVRCMPQHSEENLDEAYDLPGAKIELTERLFIRGRDY